MRWLVPLLVLLGGRALDATEVPHENLVRTEHLQVRGRVSEAIVDEAANLGEALYAHLKEHFGTEPSRADLPLRLTIHPDADSFRRELFRRGTYTSTRDVGGYTWFGRGGSHVARQRHEFDTRRLVIHELTHQFHFACRPPFRRGRDPAWYREGLAEYFGWHRRSASGIQFGVLDIVAPTRRAHDARRRTRSKYWQPERFLNGTREADYVDGLAIVGGFLSSDDAKARATFRKWEASVLTLGGERRRIMKAFPDADALRKILRTTWAAKGPDWGPAPSGWDERVDGWIQGVPSRRSALGRRIPDGEAVRLRIRPEPDGWVRVLVMGDRFTLLEWRDGEIRLRGRNPLTWPAPLGARLEMAANGDLHIFGQTDGGETPLDTVSRAAPGRWDLRLFVRAGSAAFRLDSLPDKR